MTDTVVVAGGSSGSDKIIEENKVLGIRLSLAYAWSQMLQNAYDALLHHGVNYRKLPTYSDTRILDAAERLPMEEARGQLLRWIENINSDIAAAIRRKGLVVHRNGVPPDGGSE